MNHPVTPLKPTPKDGTRHLALPQDHHWIHSTISNPMNPTMSIVTTHHVMLHRAKDPKEEEKEEDIANNSNTTSH